MNAVVSGQAKVAVLLDGETLSSLRTDRPGEVVRRTPGEVPLLFGDAKDLQFLEAVELEEVSSRLELASKEVDALHLALILLDESLEPDTRRTAAEELEEMLDLKGIQRFVENILHAHPLPRGADLAGALASCPGNANLTRRLLERLGSLQGVITEVYFAWEQIPEDLFEGKRDRAYAQSIAVREGLFRDLVALHAADGSIDRFLTTALLNKSFRKVPNSGEVLHAWHVPLRLDQAEQPQRVENLQAGAVAETTEDVHRVWLAAAAEEEGSKVFSQLVERGKVKAEKVKTEVDKMNTKVKDTFEIWSEKFDEKLAATLHRMGVPTRDEIRNLTQRIEELNAKVEQLRPATNADTSTPKSAAAMPTDPLALPRGSRN